MNLHNNEAGRRVSRALPIIFVIYVILPNLQYYFGNIRFLIIDGYCILKSKERKRFSSIWLKYRITIIFYKMVTWQPKSN